MAKTEETLKLEKAIFSETKQKNMFGCFEVTIGFNGEERVDFLTLDAKNIWRFYEIKVTKSDFYSKAHNTFYGNYNYYVIPEELYFQVKEDIPDYIGVFDGHEYIKRAKKQKLAIGADILKNSLIRSLARENQKFVQTCDISFLSRLNSRITNLEKSLRDENRKYHSLNNEYTDAVKKICDSYNLPYREVRKLIREETF